MRGAQTQGARTCGYGKGDADVRGDRGDGAAATPKGMAGRELDELIRAGSLLARELNFKSLVSTLVEQTADITRSDLCALYLYTEPEKSRSDLVMSYRRGRYSVPSRLSAESELVSFVGECDESVVLLERRASPFLDILLHPFMQSGIALPLSVPNSSVGILILNSRNALFFDKSRLHFLDSLVRIASGMLHNARLFQEMRDYLRRIEQLERYQQGIFSSMTNLLVTTDENGRIRYFNERAGERMRLEQNHIGRSFSDLFSDALDRKILRAVEKTGATGKELLGVEGIYRGEGGEMDFALNVSPLKGKRGRFEGLTFVFTDQTRERELRQQMESVVEERRLIKDMFSRYLSNEVLNALIESPEMTQLGGAKRVATVFFADIRGYTSFSEGREPEYIVKVLNEYFNEAVEIVLKHRGYIDKFIGDCIMAAFGVPLQTEEQDAVSAVSCALEIQECVRREERSFFRGEASRLRIGIGMNTGPLVAGNLGGFQRQDYTVIGDTVNIAARLEGVAKAGEVIITQTTRDFLGDHFRLEKKKPVSVKGKAKPIPIYAVKERAS